MNDDDDFRPHSDAYRLCRQALQQDHDYQAAQVYATMSVEEALHDLAGAIRQAADVIARATRR